PPLRSRAGASIALGRYPRGAATSLVESIRPGERATGECPAGRGHRFESGWGASPRGFESLTLRTLPIHGGSPVPEVVIDGVRYVAESDLPTPPWYDDPEQAPRIGIGITTLNRPDFLAATIKAFGGKLPAGAELVVVDDGSAKPVKVPDGWALHRFPENRGVPSAKNK